MTYEGALYWHTHNGATIEQERECESLIKEALEKQIPKKVTHEATLYRCCTCPTCKNVIDEFTDFTGKKYRVTVQYCKFCRQALDWSDSNADCYER